MLHSQIPLGATGGILMPGCVNSFQREWLCPLASGLTSRQAQCHMGAV